MSYVSLNGMNILSYLDAEVNSSYADCTSTSTRVPREKLLDLLHPRGKICERLTTLNSVELLTLVLPYFLNNFVW